MLLVVASLADEVASNIRRTKLLLQKSKERRQFCQLQMRHRGNACLRRRQAAADLALIEAARQCPAAAAEALSAIKNIYRRSKSSQNSASGYECCTNSMMLFGDEEFNALPVIYEFTHLISMCLKLCINVTAIISGMVEKLRILKAYCQRYSFEMR